MKVREQMEKTYHREVFMPAAETLAHKVYSLSYSRHAQEQCIHDRYGIIKPVFSVTVDRNNLIELTVSDNKVEKLLVRVKHDATTDLCLVFLANGFVKTCWLCKRDDSHKTLKRELYPVA